MLEAIRVAHEAIKQHCLVQKELEAACGKTVKREYCHEENDEELRQKVHDELYAKAYAISVSGQGKQERAEAFEKIVEDFKANYTEEELEEKAPLIDRYYHDVEKEAMRRAILDEGKRLDGRRTTDIRPIWIEPDYLPGPHGSAVFTRGETQSLTTVTLGTKSDEKIVDDVLNQGRDRFLLHYNFPPFSTGETGRVGAPKRREIGHGNLAERALVPVLPTREDFPYAIRQVSEALGSNGSTSMGSVCASTLSLLNAGVPLRAPVAGIAMGLMHEVIDGETKWATLTDILGSEDAFGDMDFKVAGTRDFITALQLDTKLDGLPSEVLAGALGQARDARLFILDVLAQAIDAPDEMAPTAPRVLAVRIPVDKIGEVIGPKGKMINQIQEDTGADLTVEDDGTVYIGASDGPSAEAARDAVNAIANPQMPEIGERFVGTVVKTTTFGAFVSLTPGKDGLLHISQIRRLVGGKRVENVEDVLGVGDKVQVELAEIDQRGKLSLHAVLTDEQLAAEAEGEVARKASRENGSRRESREGKDGEGEQPRRERRPRRRRMRSAESSEEE